MKYSRKSSHLLVLVLFFSAALFFFRLGERSFRNPDEGRYAEIAREMVVTGDWIQPKIYGVDYLRKPVLFYWLLAVSFKIFGFNEWAARSVPALFGVFGVLMTFWFARKNFDEETAFFSCLVLASNFWYLQVARYLVIDAVFSFFVVSGLYLFYSAFHAKERKQLYYLLFYACVSFSFLAKGILGLVLPGITLAIYFLKLKKIRVAIKEMEIGWGILIFSIIALPWFLMISLRNPDFLRLFFLHENLSRFISKNFEHQEAWYFYLALLPVVLLPWSLLIRPLRVLVATAREEREWADKKFFLLAAGLAFIFFFTLSRSKLLTYILPALPFSSILIGKAWHEWVREEITDRGPSHWAEGLIVIVFIFLGIAGILVTPAVILRFGQELPEGVGIYFQMMGAALLMGGVASLKAWKRRGRHHLFYLLILTVSLLSVPFSFAMEKVNVDYTSKYFAEYLKPKLKPGDKVFIYDHPGAFYDFGFYLGHPATLVGLEGELEFSRKSPENQKAVVTHDQFKKMLADKEKLYCLARKSDFL